MSHSGKVPAFDESVNRRLFIGAFSTGISYADRTQEEDNEYKRLAFLDYRTLELEWRTTVDSDLREEIITHAASIQANRGKPFEISTAGQTVILGEDRTVVENKITLDDANQGSFVGPLAAAYSYKPDLRRRITECFEAARRSTNRFFVLEGAIVRAAQATLSGAMIYMGPGRILLDCSQVRENQNNG